MVFVTRGAAEYFREKPVLLRQLQNAPPVRSCWGHSKTAEKLVFNSAMTGVMSLLPTKVKLQIPYEPKAVASPEGRKTFRKTENSMKT